MTDPIAALRGQLQQLEAQRASGAATAADYEREKARLERELLDHVMADGAGTKPAAKVASAPADPDGGAQPRPGARLSALLAVAVIALAIAGYATTGAPTLIFGEPPAAAANANAAHDLNGEQFAAAVEQLAQKLREKPDNAEGLAMLARSYAQMGRMGDAVPAYAKAVALTPDDPRLLVDYADALAVQNNRSLDGEPMKLVERALKLDPNNFKALALAGTAAFNRKDYKAAARWWEQLAATAPADSPFKQQLEGSIAEARELGGLGPAPATPGAAAGTAAPAVSPTPDTAAPGAAITGSVRLAPALKSKVSPDDIVFVFARPAEGSRMPLAILRKQVKDLPFDFSLSDAMAMSPGARISLFPKIVVDARVSKSGQAQPAAGDLVGRSDVLPNTATGVTVEIKDVVK